MTELLAAVFVASLTGSLHCAGMCGGIVAFCSGADAMTAVPDRRHRAWVTQLAYNGGRLLTYISMGSVAGAIGAALDIAGSAAQLQRTAALLAGITMVIWGLAALLHLSGVRPRFFRRIPIRFERWYGVAVAGLRDRSPIVRAIALGLLTTVLPCGWLYAFVVAAAGTGRAYAGAAVMVAFWLGTLPMMLGLGIGVRRLAGALGRVLPVVTAVFVLVIGVLGLTGRAAVPMHHATHESARGPSVRRVLHLAGAKSVAHSGSDAKQ